MTSIRSTTPLLALAFLSQTFSFAYTMLPTLLTADQTITPIQAGLVLAAVTLFAGLWQPGVGRRLDTGRIRGSFVIIAVTYGFGIYAFLAKNSSWHLLVGGALGICIAMTTLRTMLGTALMGMIPSDQRAKMAGRRYLVANAGLGVSAGVAFFWLDTQRSLLMLTDLATTLLLGAGAVWFLRRHTRQYLATRPSQTSADGPTDGQVLWQAVRRHGWQIGGLTLIEIGFLLHISYLPLFFAAAGLPAARFNSLMLAVNTIGVTLLVRVVGHCSRRLPETARGALAVLLVGGGMALIPVVPTLTGVVVGTVIWTLGEVLFIPWQQAKLYESMPAGKPGLASGALILLSSISTVVAPLIATVMLALPTGAGAAVLFVFPAVGLALFCKGRSAKVEVAQDPQTGSHFVAA